MSEISMSSNKSQHSYNFSLSSNKSSKQQDQIKCQDLIQYEHQHQCQEFKQKLCKLFNLKSKNLTNLYEQIQLKWSSKFVQQKIIQFDQMLSSLSKVKKNNREMTKLISILGIKIENNKRQHKNHNQTILNNQIQKQQTNPTQTSQEYYNYKFKPTNIVLTPFHRHQHNKRQQSIHFEHTHDYNNEKQDQFNTNKRSDQNQKNGPIYNKQSNPIVKNEQSSIRYYDIYKQKNKAYEDKIKNMFQQLANIRNQIKSVKKIQNFQNQQKHRQPLNNIIKRNDQNQQIGKNLQNKDQKIRKQKTLSNQKYKTKSQKQLNINHQPTQFITSQQPNSLLQNNNNTKTFQMQKYSKSQQKYSNNQQKQPQPVSLMDDYIQKTNIKNNNLIQHAKNITKKLQQIKQQTLLFQKNKQKEKANQQKNANSYNNSTNPHNYILSSTMHEPQVLDYMNIQTPNQNKSSFKTDINENLGIYSSQKQYSRQRQQYYQSQPQNQRIFKNQTNHLNVNQTQNCNQNDNEFNPSQIQKLQPYESDDDSQFSVKNQQLPSISIKGNKKKSILDQMKNVQSKVLISENQIIHNDPNQPRKNSFNQFQSKPYNKSHNLVSHGSVINSLTDSVSNSSGKQVVISYLTMQQPPNIKKQLNQNQRNRFTSPSSNRYSNTFQEQNSNSNDQQRRISVHKIQPSSNNISNYHNTSIMNAKGPFINKSKQKISNSSIIQVQWQNPIAKNIQTQYQNHTIPNRQNQTNHSFYNSINSINNSRIIANANLPLIKANTPHHIVVSSIPQTQPIRRISINQPPSFNFPHNLVPFQSKIQSASTNQNTPIKHVLTKNQPTIRPIQHFFGQNCHQQILSHSNSAININMNDFQNRFKNLQNRSSLSQQKNNNPNNDLFLNNTSYLNKQGNAIQNRNSFNGNNTLFSNGSSFNSSNLVFVPKKSTLKNPFQELKSQYQMYDHNNNILQKRQSIPRKNSFTGLNMSFANNKLEPSVILGSSSKHSRTSKDSRDSRKSKSKGLNLLSQGV